MSIDIETECTKVELTEQLTEHLFGPERGFLWYCQQDYTHLTTLKLKGKGTWVEVSTEGELQNLICYLNEKGVPYRILGAGSNVVIEQKPNNPIIRLNFPLERVNLNFQTSSNHWWFPANTPLSHLTALARKHALAGWELFTGIPAQLGGAIAMNAGTRLGEMASLVSEVRTVTRQGEIKTYQINRPEDYFGYRENKFLDPFEIVTFVKLKSLGFDQEVGHKIRNYLQLRSQTQPLTAATCGCLFANSPHHRPMGQLIEEAQLKGVHFNHLYVSQIHGNFVENRGQKNFESYPTSIDFKKMIDLISSTIFLRYGFRPRLEVQFI